MAFHKILCPVDFSPGSRHAMRVAARLASDADTELVLVHVWHLPVSNTEELPFPADTVRRMVQDEERGLVEAAEVAAKLGARRVSTKFLSGVPWDEILETLHDPAFDLVVVGTSGRTGFARILLGSVTEKVVRHSPCSVLVARGRGDLPSYNHVLCPVDFSESSRHAVELAAGLVGPGGGGVTLLHVIEVPSNYSGEPMLVSFSDDVKRNATRLLEQWGRDLSARTSAPVALQSKIGSPGRHTLAALDDDRTFDLVVMGSHGRTGFRRLVLGSVAEKVVRHADCDVLVARTRLD